MLNQSTDTPEHSLTAVSGNTATQGVTITKENLFAQYWVLFLKNLKEQLFFLLK